MVRRVFVERSLPAFQQVRTHQRQEQQHRQAEPESHDLDRARAAAAGHVGETVAPRDADPGAETADRRDEPAADQVQRRRDHQDAADQDNEHARVADGAIQQAGHRRQRQSGDQQARRGGRHRVVAQHAQRRRIAQLDQGRQRETEQQQQRAAAGENHRPQPGLRQVAGEQVGEQPRQELLGRVADDAAGRDAQHAEDHQLDQRDRNDEALRGAEALHQRDRVHPPVREAARGHGYSDRAQQQADDGGQRQEPLCAIGGAVGAFAALLLAADAYRLGQLVLDCRVERRDGCLFAGDQQRVADPAALTDQPAALDVRDVHQQ